MSKSYTPPMSTLRRLAKVRKKLRVQLKELTHAHEFYINNHHKYSKSEVNKVHQTILQVKTELLFPSLY